MPGKAAFASRSVKALANCGSPRNVASTSPPALRNELRGTKSVSVSFRLRAHAFHSSAVPAPHHSTSPRSCHHCLACIVSRASSSQERLRFPHMLLTHLRGQGRSCPVRRASRGGQCLSASPQHQRHGWRRLDRAGASRLGAVGKVSDTPPTPPLHPRRHSDKTRGCGNDGTSAANSPRNSSSVISVHLL